jgi:hypothetical protein
MFIFDNYKWSPITQLIKVLTDTADKQWEIQPKKRQILSRDFLCHICYDRYHEFALKASLRQS